MVLCGWKNHILSMSMIFIVERISMEGEDVSKGFQGSGKHVERKERSTYMIDLVLDVEVAEHLSSLLMMRNFMLSCYLIAVKVMKNYSKGECTLDVISIIEFCK
jgi:hypothetical protein